MPHASLTRGLGRSYGDSSIPAAGASPAANCRLADRLLAFDPDSGRLRAESGVTIFDLRRTFLPRGFFVPVTPGTQFVTLGGMVASDVHGKNHHVEGTFGRHVHALVLHTPARGVVRCSRDEHPDLFRATLGGMGLTGHILEVEFDMARIPSPWIYREERPIPNLEEFIGALKASAERWPMTMGWIDCLSTGKSLGRGVLIRGRWATPDEAPRRAPAMDRPTLTFPFDLPQKLLNPWTVRAFNALYYRKTLGRTVRGISHPVPFFYPLDAIYEWNRMYGRAGFTQYQCVLPEDGSGRMARRFLERLASLQAASFLCVIKDCGPEGEGVLSFPMPGISIALDIPMRPHTARVIDELNELVIECGGRIYLTKDTLTRAEHFRAMDPRVDQFLRIRRIWDPHQHLSSAQSARLFGDHPPSDPRPRIVPMRSES